MVNVIKACCAHDRRYFIVSEHGEGERDPGWMETNTNKIEQAWTVQNLLGFGMLTIMEDFICPMPFNENMDADSKREFMISTLKQQMYRYNVFGGKRTSPLSHTKRTVSGKTDSEGKFNPFFKDDLIVAMCWNVWLQSMISKGEIPNQPSKYKL
jgi:hypothetical protein